MLRYVLATLPPGEYVVYVYDSMQYPFFRGEAHHQLGSYRLSEFFTEKTSSI